MVKSKKISKKDKRRIKLIFSVMVLLLSFIVLSIGKIWFQVFDKKQESQILKIKIDNLVNEEQTLKNELIKLQNADYLARYAREKYLYSRDGEITIKIP